MAWIYLLVAGFLEILWAWGLKQTQGFTRLGPSLFTLLCMGASFAFLAQSLKEIPLGTAYAVWTGIGAFGTALVGLIFMGEPRDGARLFCLALIGIGVVGLKFFSK